MNLKRRDLSSLLVCLLLACATLAAFWPVWHCEFVEYDDDFLITNNPHVRGGLTWEGITWAFRTSEFGNWHPLTWLSHMLDCQLYGLQPAGHHLTSLLFHVANVLLLFLALRRLTGAPVQSAMVAALFALHPLRVESVAWVAERKDVLSTFFFMLTLWAYARYARKSDVRGQKLVVGIGATPAVSHSPFSLFYLLALFFFALGLMSKPMLVTLPFVLLLLDYWPLRRLPLSPFNLSLSTCRHLLLEKVPFFLLSAGCSVITLHAQRVMDAMVPTIALGFGLRVENALIAYVRYLGKTFCPVNLAVFYPYAMTWPLWEVFGAGALLLGVSLLVVRAARSRPYLLVGWLWFLGMLVPVIGLVQVGGQSMADRYTYLPLIGVFVMLVWLAAELVAIRPRNAWVLWAVGVAALLGCVVATRGQLRHWENSQRLFENALRVTRNNAVAHFGMATVRSRQGKPEEAIVHFTEAVRLQPGYAEAYNNLGAELLEQGRLAEALVHLNRALEINPNYANAHSTLGVALAHQGKTAEAIMHFRAALRCEPNHVNTHFNLGLALIRQGWWDEAARHFAEVVRLKPGFADAHNNLGLLHLRQSRFADAEAQFQHALEHGADPAVAHYNLGQACAGQGKSDAAIGRFREALRLQPDWPAPLNDLGWLLATHVDGRYRDGSEAIKLTERAAALTRRRDAGMLDTLAAAYAEAGRFAEAEATAQEALSVAKSAGLTALAEQIEKRCQGYILQQPWRELR